MLARLFRVTGTAEGWRAELGLTVRHLFRDETAQTSRPRSRSAVWALPAFRTGAVRVEGLALPRNEDFCGGRICLLRLRKFYAKTCIRRAPPALDWFRLGRLQRRMGEPRPTPTARLPRRTGPASSTSSASVTAARNRTRRAASILAVGTKQRILAARGNASAARHETLARRVKPPSAATAARSSTEADSSIRRDFFDVEAQRADAISGLLIEAGR